MSLRMLHIVTVGTSLVRNACRNANAIDVLSGYRDLLCRWSMALPESAEDVEAGKNAYPGSDVFKALLGYIDSRPRESSAELNSLLGYLTLLESEGVKASHDIILISTDSGVCWLCTRILEEYLRDLSRGRIKDLGFRAQSIGSVSSKRIPMLGRDFRLSSLNLLAEVKKIILYDRSRYDVILVNLTAGFKPESGLLLIASALYGADKAYYMHEAMKEVVEIPLIRMKISDDVRGMLTKLAKGQPLTSIEIETLYRIGLLPPSKKVTDWSRRLAEELLI